MSFTHHGWRDEIAIYNAPHRRLNMIATLVNRSSVRSVIDVGCGQGYLQNLLDSGVGYLGLDFIADENEESQVRRWDMNQDAFPEGLSGFDCVTASGSLEYCQELPKLLLEIRAGLPENGLFVCSYFNMNHLQRAYRVLIGKSVGVHPGWRNFYSPADVQRLLVAAGFDVVAVYPVQHALTQSGTVADTLTRGSMLKKRKRWSRLFASQFIFECRARPRQR